jgi:hypothetical protein
LDDQQTTRSHGFSPDASISFPAARLMKNRAGKTALLLLSLIVAIGLKCSAQQPTEYQIEAAYLYNFARFVAWPSQAFPSTNAPMVIGVLGDNVFGNSLQHIINNRKINGHALQFVQFDTVTAATNCEILFISASEKNHLSKILVQLQGTSILTVSEADNFIGDGGMIYLFIDEENKVRFQINNDAARKAGLTISSKLLSLAANN